MNDSPTEQPTRPHGKIARVDTGRTPGRATTNAKRTLPLDHLAMNPSDKETSHATPRNTTPSTTAIEDDHARAQRNVTKGMRTS